MAASVSVVRNMGGLGGMAAREVTITGDSSYPSGGYAITANSCGLGSINDVFPVGSSSGYSPHWDQANSKLLLFGDTSAVQAITKAVTVATMTDNTDTTGFIDFTTSSLPAGAIVMGWKFVASAAFTGDTSAVVKVGVSGDLDRFSATTTGSVFGAGTVTSAPLATGAFKTASAQTPRITITSASDFTLVVSNATGAGTCTLYYVLPASASVGAAVECITSTDVSTIVTRALVLGTP